MRIINCVLARHISVSRCYDFSLIFISLTYKFNIITEAQLQDNSVDIAQLKFHAKKIIA